MTGTPSLHRSRTGPSDQQAAPRSSGPGAEPPGGPTWRWLLWAWRRLTSMRTAVILLVLLGAASIPGSLLPQRGVASDPVAVPMFFREHPDLAPWLDRIQFFGVYSSAWFAAIYLLLLVSMTGCVVPRCVRLWQDARAAPPPAPRRMERESGHRRIHLDPAEADEALASAAAVLRRRRFAVVAVDGEVRAERGRVRELGNLVFHLSLLVLLVGVAGGKLLGYEGRVAVVEGQGFTNVASSYDALTPGPLADVTDLESLDFTLDEFEARFAPSGARVGEPRDFDAAVSYRSAAEGDGTLSVRPNRPLEINGTKFFLTGHGYAPSVTVRDGNGDVALSGPTIFLPSDANFTSDGVLKVPDAEPESLALSGTFLPTAATTQEGSTSAFPGPANPRLELTAYRGDLGLDSGRPQSVFGLDFTDLRPVLDEQGREYSVVLAPGQTARLPGGLGSVTFDGFTRFANFQVARDPGKEVALLAALLLLAGLTVSLGVPRRRIWVRRTPDGIELAARSLSRRGVPDRELATLHTRLQERPGTTRPQPTDQEGRPVT